MEEVIPPGKGVNTSSDRNDTDQNLSAAATTGSQPDAANTIPIEGRTPQKDNLTDEVSPPSSNARKYRVMYENMRKRFMELKKTCDDQMAKHVRVMGEKDAAIKELNTRLGKHAESRPCMLKMCNEDVFVAKLKKGAKSPTKGCEISGCDNSDVDLIKCNMCGNLVCEECSGAKVVKLRPIMNQCKTLYFTCPSCDVQVRDKSDVNAYDVLKEKVEMLTGELGNCDTAKEKLAQQVKTLDEHQTSLKQLLEERENSLHETEAKLVSMEHSAAAVSNEPGGTVSMEELINRRFDNIDKSIEALIDKKLAGVLPHPTTEPSNSGDTRKLSFSGVVGGTSATTSHVSEMKTSRNAELIEKQEQDRRVNNILIHGISEETTGENVNSPDQDRNFIKSFLEAIEVDVAPKQILRLGNKSPDKKRPVKVILKNADDKEKIMSGLNKLKNADPSLRAISVRDDYTQEERKLIRTMNEEATRLNEADNVTHWKVRGTPKNGLRVVKIITRN